MLLSACHALSLLPSPPPSVPPSLPPSSIHFKVALHLSPTPTDNPPTTHIHTHFPFPQTHIPSPTLPQSLPPFQLYSLFPPRCAPAALEGVWSHLGRHSQPPVKGGRKASAEDEEQERQRGRSSVCGGRGGGRGNQIPLQCEIMEYSLTTPPPPPPPPFIASAWLLIWDLYSRGVTCCGQGARLGDLQSGEEVGVEEGSLLIHMY